jgi:hypothetical protein
VFGLNSHMGTNYSCWGFPYSFSVLLVKYLDNTSNEITTAFSHVLTNSLCTNHYKFQYHFFFKFRNPRCVGYIKNEASGRVNTQLKYRNIYYIDNMFRPLYWAIIRSTVFQRRLYSLCNIYSYTLVVYWLYHLLHSSVP